MTGFELSIDTEGLLALPSFRGDGGIKLGFKLVFCAKNTND